MKLSFVKIKKGFKNAIKIIGRFPLLIARNVFPIFIGLSVIVLIVGALMYYRYGASARVAGDEQSIAVPKIERNILNGILSKLNEKEYKLKGDGVTEEFDPFNQVLIPNPEIVDQ